MTITEMAEKLKIPRKTVEMRILRGGYKPITKDALYSNEVFEAIKNVPGKGRPKKENNHADNLSRGEVQEPSKQEEEAGNAS